VCPEKIFNIILALGLGFVSNAKRMDRLSQGSWLKQPALVSAILAALA
jgi:hypothetical protein